MLYKLWAGICLVSVRLPGLLGQHISVTYPRRTARNFLEPRDPERIGRAK